ncbi:MAG TPA: hypothetical protein VNU68_05225, partial [Verrucomicrobiae bacterium]|nr:hypothetical protein [Verrucomicrobiae bacterium]
RTAEAQLAMAEAAFQVGVITADPQWLTLGRNLTALVLNEFRPGVVIGGGPRGITRYPVLPPRELYGVKLWPDAERYPVGCNARAYLLLSRLEDLAGRYFSDPPWRLEITQALREQEQWLRQFILPQAERHGVVPGGVFEVQDIHRETSALAVDRWTSTEDWLWLVEAARRMGLPLDTTRRWLENLARVHGVHVQNIWGLDWTLGLSRPDAISTELTARFARLATALGHPSAGAFAQQNLQKCQQNGQYPATRTEASPQAALRAGQGSALHPRTNAPVADPGWPLTLSVFKELQEAANPGWGTPPVARLETKPVAEVWPPQRADLTVFIAITAAFYLFIILSTLFWWRFRTLRQRHRPAGLGRASGGTSGPALADQLVPDAVMQRAEERWAKRVLGMQTPAQADHTRFSNGPVEQNFLMQLRTIYKLVLEWRRRENGWSEEDPRLVEDERDRWLNGLDEFVCLMGIYMRWVIKAGAKDGFARKAFLMENEDSNHIWSRLTMYFSEYYWALLPLLKPIDPKGLAATREQEGAAPNPFGAFPGLGGDPVEHQQAELNSKVMLLLNMMGLRQRAAGFDGRRLFDYPANPAALDLLIIQKPGMTLPGVLQDVSSKLGIPLEHIVRVIGAYKEFKRREKPDPIHPYLIEFGKVLPHFLVMGLGALVWYNQTTGDSPIVPYLWSVTTQLALTTASLGWALPLLAGLILAVLSRVTRTYRHEATMLPRETPAFFLDATVTSLFTREQSVIPQIKPGHWWNPAWYERAGWMMRVMGFTWLGVVLLRLETPSFSTFLIVKGLLALLAFGEVAGILLPLAGSGLSKWLQDRVTTHPRGWAVTRFLNRLNITATRSVSPLWLSIRYHMQPSVPSGTFWGMVQAILFYLVFSAVFFFVGGFLCQQVLSLWFTDTYLNGSDLKLLVGGCLFWNTMYLLRYGLFLMFTGLASLWVTFPIKTAFGLLAGGHLLLMLVGPALGLDRELSRLSWPVVLVALGLMLAEDRMVGRFRRWRDQRARAGETGSNSGPGQMRGGGDPRLGVIYMSGDDLSYLKLTPALLLSRWTILREKLGSESLRLLHGMVGRPSDATLASWFEKLYQAEQQANMTLWHPIQLCLDGERPAFRPELGLQVSVRDAEEHRQLLAAWHVRRWLVAMMATAGHSQDTGINLVDIALRLHRDGWAGATVFYLVQNKYDNNENNRPSQTAYDQGELHQRNQLCRLLEAVAPGVRAYNLQNWTPFGFKAGGLTGMDLVYEETLKLTTMLLLDRNATVHDLDALMGDLRQALSDPDIVVIIPGRSTTNTLTPLGQGSQMVEEGHRSYLKGLLWVLGGSVGESVGTGWGNILAAYYGRTQRAMVDLSTPKMPLTSRMQRGASFLLKYEGLIGFAPHAVGISEDTWAVSQTAHNALALGRRTRFLLSRALWHKLRETWSHSEWLASFPRWSGGYLQMMHDPLMQRINDFGPTTVFAKEIRAQSGRNFLSAPFALFNILIMPLAIMLDVTPFVQILIVLWNFGFILNQILTLHGLNTQLESSGFYRLPAVAGALAATLLFTQPGWQTYAPAAVLLGFLAGGFMVGLSRWLYNRVRDTILFGPQLVLHTLGQLVRQSLEFVVSGASPEDAKAVNMSYRTWAGPREDRPLDEFNQIINLKTVVWWVGVSSLILNAFALASLGMLNVLLLLPSLLFSVSLMAGPFIMCPKVGQTIGKRVLIPQILGWITALSFYTSVSLLVAQGGGAACLGSVALLGAAALLLRQGLKYAFYRTRLRGALRRLRDLLTHTAGTTPGEAAKRVSSLVQSAAGDPANLPAELERVGISAAQQRPYLDLIQDRLRPLLRRPVAAALEAPFAQNRWVSEFGRSLTLAGFVLAWFFIVPVPGLFVFTAGQYRFASSLWTILGAVGIAVVLVVAGAWAGVLIQWWHRRGLGQRGLAAKID